MSLIQSVEGLKEKRTDVSQGRGNSISRSLFDLVEPGAGRFGYRCHNAVDRIRGNRNTAVSPQDLSHLLCLFVFEPSHLFYRNMVSTIDSTTMMIITIIKFRIHFPLLPITLTIVSEKRYKNHENMFHFISTLCSKSQKKRMISFFRFRKSGDHPIFTSFPNTA